MPDFTEMRQIVERLAEDYPIKSMSCFGSYADGTQTEERDMDFLVEFDTLSISLIKLAGLKRRLEERLGLPVNLIHAPIPPESYIKIEDEAVIYERA
ncbi:MAG: nucleotidyltransferase domain-containing protein [Synergistaceae bacterium]|jgi:predicted nucleotidyltransferase|nr:nucleotidyltransferase domain-containing protein [Synergistaceae bacterium]